MINPFRLRGLQRDRIQSSSSGSTVSIYNGKLISSDNYTDARIALANSDIFAVINKVSADVAGCEFIAQEPFKAILDKPTSLISGFNFWQGVLASLLLSGNAYVVITGRDVNNVPTRLEMASPLQVNVLLSDDSQDISYQVNWNDSRAEETYNPSDVLHFRLLSPYGNESSNYLTGISPLYSLKNDLAVQEQSKQLTLSTLMNAIHPSTILTLPDAQVSNEAKDALRDSFQAQASGDNVGKVFVLDQSAQLSTLAIDSDVASFLSNYDFSQQQIAKAFNIPNSVLDDQKGDQQSNTDQIRSLYADALLPYMNAITSELTLKLGVKVSLDVNSVIDVTNQNLIDNLIKMGTGKNQILTSEDIIAIMKAKNIYGLADINLAPVTEAEGGDTDD